jgi:4-amino-4-deoxy-L-arabinose transferase-like glycosyltransferase
VGGRALFAIFLLAALVRFGAAAASGLSTAQFGDAEAYLSAARTIVATGDYPATTDLGFFRAPGYPAFLVLATLGVPSPSRIALAKVANVVLGAVAVVLLVALSGRIFRSRAIAIATGVAGGLAPGLVLISSEVQSEALFLVLLLGAAFLLLAAVDRPSSSLSLVAGAALGLAALTRPTALAFVPFLLAPLFDTRYPLRARSHIAAAAFLGMIATVAPWTIRNALVFHELIPVSDAGGRAFYEGNSHLTRGYFSVTSLDGYQRWIAAEKDDLEEKLRRIEREGVHTPGRRSRAFRDLALEEIRANPAEELRLLGRKSWLWLRPYPTPWFHPRLVVWATGIYYVCLDLLAAVGLASASVLRPGVRKAALGVLVVSFAVHVAIIVVWRYRIPLWDPVLLLYAVPGGARLVRA